MIKHLRIASDLHLEGFTGRNSDTLLIDFIPRDPRDADSLLVLAGDISSIPSQLILFLAACLEKFPKVLFVPGNHEYYKHDFQAWNRIMSDRLFDLGDRLLYATDDVRVSFVDGVRYIYGTLWADGGPTLADQAKVGFYLNDFRLITNGFHPDHGSQLKFTVQDMIAKHRSQKHDIETALRSPFDGRTVVITHHLPSRRLVSARFWPIDASDGANGGFASDCDTMIAVHEPSLWIHGHTHDTIDTELWKTRIVCHPAGYRGEYATPFNTFMRTEPRENGQGLRAMPVPKFIDL